MIEVMLNVSMGGVVSAPLAPIRASIEGQVSLTGNAQPGDFIIKGTKLFSIVNNRADARSLTELNAKLTSLSNGIAILDDQLVSLETFQGSLLIRAELHRAATASRLEAMIAEANAALEGARAAASQAADVSLRAGQLLKRGVVAQAKEDEVTAEKTRAFAEVHRLQAAVKKLTTELKISSQGHSNWRGIQ